MPWCKCGHYITLTQASLSSRRDSRREPACKDCVTKELTAAKLAEDPDEVWDIGASNKANDAYWRKVHFPELEQKRCDHKFVDSGHCLKCGWRP